MQAFEGRGLTKSCDSGVVSFCCEGTGRGEPCQFAFKAKTDNPKTLQFRVTEFHEHTCFGVGKVPPRINEVDLVKEAFTEVALRLRGSLSVTETPMEESMDSLDTRFILQFHNLLARDYGLLLETKCAEEFLQYLKEIVKETESQETWLEQGHFKGGPEQRLRRTGRPAEQDHRGYTKVYSIPPPQQPHLPWTLPQPTSQYRGMPVETDYPRRDTFGWPVHRHTQHEAAPRREFVSYPQSTWVDPREMSTAPAESESYARMRWSTRLTEPQPELRNAHLPHRPPEDFPEEMYDRRYFDIQDAHACTPGYWNQPPSFGEQALEVTDRRRESYRGEYITEIAPPPYPPPPWDEHPQPQQQPSPKSNPFSFGASQTSFSLASLSQDVNIPVDILKSYNASIKGARSSRVEEKPRAASSRHVSRTEEPDRTAMFNAPASPWYRSHHRDETHADSLYVPDSSFAREPELVHRPRRRHDRWLRPSRRDDSYQMDSSDQRFDRVTEPTQTRSNSPVGEQEPKSEYTRRVVKGGQDWRNGRLVSSAPGGKLNRAERSEILRSKSGSSSGTRDEAGRPRGVAPGGVASRVVEFGVGASRAAASTVGVPLGDTSTKQKRSAGKTPPETRELPGAPEEEEETESRRDDKEMATKGTAPQDSAGGGTWQSSDSRPFGATNDQGESEGRKRRRREA